MEIWHFQNCYRFQSLLEMKIGKKGKILRKNFDDIHLNKTLSCFLFIIKTKLMIVCIILKSIFFFNNFISQWKQSKNFFERLRKKISFLRNYKYRKWKSGNSNFNGNQKYMEFTHVCKWVQQTYLNIIHKKI